MNCPRCKEDTIIIEDCEFNHSQQCVQEFYVCETCLTSGTITSYMEFHSIQEDESLEYGDIL